LCFGYSLAETRRVKINPYAGIGFSDIEPLQDDTKKHPELSGEIIGTGVNWIFGISTDYKLSARHPATYYGEDNYYPIRLGLSINKPSYFDINNKIDGYYMGASLTIGLFGSTSKAMK
jgi:hypothetical protein